MGLLKHFRSRSRLKIKEERQAQKQSQDLGYRSHYNGASPFVRQYTGPDRISRLPANILGRIFLFVCPHAGDGSFEPSETPLAGEECMLCDLRDLAACQLVRRSWVQPVQQLMYTNIRIDAVHFCELEEILTEKRKHKRFLDRNGDPPDVPAVRLNLLARTLRSSLHFAQKVLVLKLPYMTRETCKSDLARAISVCRNLRYVDLPDGFFTGDSSCHGLRTELTARCPDIRKMRYKRGGEGLFELLAGVQNPLGHWQALEQLELTELRADPAVIRRALNSENLPRLHSLRLDGFPALTDALFRKAASLPDFPAVASLTILNAPNLTAQGLLAYLALPQPPHTLSALTLTDTSVATSDIHAILSRAQVLTRLGVTTTVTQPLPLPDMYSSDASAATPYLVSRTLLALHFELTSSSSYLSDAPAAALEPPANSHYAYLASSLASGSLPRLRTLYVREPNFSQHLLMAAPLPAPGFSGFADANPATGLPRSLAIYTKGLGELDWVYTPIEDTTTITPTTSPPRGRHTSTLQNPGPSPPSNFAGAAPGDRSSVVSGFGAFNVSSLGGAGAPAVGGNGGLGGNGAAYDPRRSVVIGNGFGGFLAVPDHSDSPTSPKKTGGFANDYDSFGGGGSSSGRPGSAGGYLSVDKRTSHWGKHQKGGSWGGGPMSAAEGGEKGGFFNRLEKRSSRHDLWR